MKVEMKASGILVIRAESELEAYALDCWACDFFAPDNEPKKRKVVVDCSFSVEAVVPEGKGK